MYSDTHFHFAMTASRLNCSGSQIILDLLERNCFFALDIGTECDDFSHRRKVIQEAVSALPKNVRGVSEDLIRMSVGIWPSKEAILERHEQFEVLRKNVLSFPEKIVAIGECGIDHHYGCVDEIGEAELFEMQLSLARQVSLPVIVHSRDGFAATLQCIKNVGYDRGIIHCYSYGKEEAEKFFERGWYISFSGAITYSKKSKLEEAASLLKSIPKDRILLETDSPYLAPVPFRGKTNTPSLVEHVYRFVSEVLGMSPEELSVIVDENCRRLFSL